MEGWNYFNYFTEIEEYFWKKRGAHLLVSPLDWAIMETWQKAEIPLEVVLRGIDHAFESYSRSRRGAGKPLKSLAYCADAVLDAAEEAKEAAAGSLRGASKVSKGLERTEIENYLDRNIAAFHAAAGLGDSGGSELHKKLREIAQSLESTKILLQAPGSLDLEDLERRLTILDEKVHAALLSVAGEELLLRIRREMDAQLAAYRRKMKAEQIALVEKQYVQKRLLEEFRLPRLSLFYLS
jgi:hypothetical protein